MCVCTGCSRAPPPKAHERSSCSALIRGRPTLFSARHFSCLRCTSVLLAEPLLLVHHVVCVIFMAMPMCTLRPRRLATFVPRAPGCPPGAQKGSLGPPPRGPEGAPGSHWVPWAPGSLGPEALRAGGLGKHGTTYAWSGFGRGFHARLWAGGVRRSRSYNKRFWRSRGLADSANSQNLSLRQTSV